MHQCGFGPPLRLPFLTSVLELTDQLLLLGVDRNHGLTPLQKGLRRRIDVLELRVPVGCEAPSRLLRIACRL